MSKYDHRIVTESAEDNPKYEIFDREYRMNARVLQYFHEQTAKEFLQYTLAPVAGGTALGACIGACTAGPGGALFGGSIGFASGAVYSTYANYGAYREWLILHKETVIFNEFENLHREHAALQEFIDPITRCLALDPVRDPFGQIYDRSTLIALAKRKADGMIVEPFHNRVFSGPNSRCSGSACQNEGCLQGSPPERTGYRDGPRSSERVAGINS